MFRFRGRIWSCSGLAMLKSVLMRSAGREGRNWVFGGARPASSTASLSICKLSMPVSRARITDSVVSRGDVLDQVMLLHTASIFCVLYKRNKQTSSEGRGRSRHAATD